MSMDEMRKRGWDEADVVFITGDAYIDHPSFGMALIGRLNRACVKRPWVPEALRYEGAFEEYLQKLWFDTHVHDIFIMNYKSSIITRGLILS